MKGYYKTGWGITFLVMGIVLFLLNLMLLNMGRGNGMQLIICLFLMLSGVLYLTMPSFELTQNELIMFNLFGMPVRRYAYASKNDFQFMDEKIHLLKDGKLKRIRISKMMVKTADWNALIYQLTKDDLTTELHNI